VNTIAKTPIVLLAIIAISAGPALAFGPANARLHGFGGAGIAIAPQDGRTAIAVNPAAPGFLRQRQFNISLSAGDRDTTGENFNLYPMTDEKSLASGGAEGYLPIGQFTLFAGLGTSTVTRDWEQRGNSGEHSLWDDGHDKSYHGNLGLAGRIGDLVSIGGQLLLWDRTTRGTGRGYHYDESYKVHSGELGVLVVTPAQVNVGVTWRSEDTEGERYGNHLVTAIQEALKIGAAWQKKGGHWLAGIEYVSLRKIDLEEADWWGNIRFDGDLYMGEDQVHLYGEYHWDRWTARAGVCHGDGEDTVATDNYYDEREHYYFDNDLFVISLGFSGRATDRIGWDLFLQRAEGDGRGDHDATRWPVYTYSSDTWLAGFGVTVLF